MPAPTLPLRCRGHLGERRLPHPVPGDIVVFNWGEGSGHVGFFVSATSTIVKLLGGNQGDAVNIKDWSKGKVYRIRKPA